MFLFYRIILLLLFSSSIYSPPFIIIPFLVPAVKAETIDRGVEITNAHGQEITNKTNALYIHVLNVCCKLMGDNCYNYG